MENMKVEILSRDFVKPSSPTPKHLRDYKLCLLDQFIPEHHGGVIFFYSSPEPIAGAPIDAKLRYSRALKKSLSETLTLFYPIAGRFKDTSTIDCNDAGACFVEAEIDSGLADFLAAVDVPSDVHASLRKLVPSLDSDTMGVASESMMMAQLTVFNCGGFALSLCLQHRFCDFSSVVTFVRSWSSTCRRSEPSDHPPDFTAASSSFPPQNMPPLPKIDGPTTRNRTTKRLIFDATKISELRSRFSPEKISRVEAILALILQSAIAATGSSSPAIVFQSVNLRNRTTPPLPETSIGNLFWMLPVKIEPNQSKLHQIVTLMKRETTSFNAQTLAEPSVVFESARERGEMVKTLNDMDIYWCSSWCRFSVYDVDFGWGRPSWMRSGVLVSMNMIVLEDTKCGTGVQAWVTLEPRVMAVFERDDELLAFASLSSSAHDLVVHNN